MSFVLFAAAVAGRGKFSVRKMNEFLDYRRDSVYGTFGRFVTAHNLEGNTEISHDG